MTTRRRGGHESFQGPCSREGALEIGNVTLNCRVVPVHGRSDTDRVGHRSFELAGQAGEILRELAGARQLTGLGLVLLEAGQAVGDIGRVARLADFAVADHVDSRST